MSFELIKSEYIDFIKSEGQVYKHDTGAVLIYLKNSDKNRVFSITFKTLPENDKGIPHIMEHCVLCGSKNYKLSDPFNELDKSTLHTYLNAITYCDKTIFPLASTNESELYKMSNVYLDAVFFPLIYEEKRTFYQEGWHYDNGCINGVVYNEMKGAYSSAERLLDYYINKHLFKNSGYSFDSAGIPSNISLLQYHEFLDFHKKFYQPSNCIIYLYGDLEIEKYLDNIDKNYLSKAYCTGFSLKYNPIVNNITSHGNIQTYYTDNINKNNNYHAAAFACGLSTDYTQCMALKILFSAIFDNEQFDYKNIFLKNDIAENITAAFDFERYIPLITVKAIKSCDLDYTGFKDSLYKLLRNIYENGIDKRVIDASKNRFMFYLKNEDFGYKPKGLFYNLALMQSFLYGDISFLPIEYDKLFQEIKDISYEDLISKYLIQNFNSVFISLIADGKSNDLMHFNKMLDIKALSIKDYHSDIKYNGRISTVSRKELNKKNKIHADIDSYKESRIIFNNINSDIVYLNLYFDTTNIPNDKICYIGLLKYFLGRLDTDGYSYSQLSNELNYYFGYFKFDFDIFNSDNELGYIPFLKLSISTFKENIKYIFKFINEIIFKTCFKNRFRIQSLLFELKTEIEKNIIISGENYCLNRCLSYNSNKNIYLEYINGVDFYNFIKYFSENFDNLYNNFIKELQEISCIIFNNKYITLNVSCNYNYFDMIYSDYIAFYNSIDVFKANNSNLSIKSINKNEAFIIDSNVQYNTKAADYINKGYHYNGHMKVAESIINMDYIWNKIRGERGAYGGCSAFERTASKTGMFYIYSFKDPNIYSTFKLYDELYQYLERINISENELYKYIIGTINNIDKPIKNCELGWISIKRHYEKITDEFINKERFEILNTRLKDIKHLAEVVYSCMNENLLCTFGNKQSIEKYRYIFNKVEFFEDV